MQQRKNELREDYLIRRKTYQKNYWDANKEYFKAKSREKYWANHNKNLEISRAYYKANSEKRKAYQKEYGETHRDEQKAYNALRYSNQRGKPSTYIYRKGMEMLYVGRSDQIGRRLYRHELRKEPWVIESDSVEVRNHATYGDSLVHEAKLIATFQPKYNREGVTK